MRPIVFPPRLTGRPGRIDAGTALAVLVLLVGALGFSHLQLKAGRAHQSESLLATVALHMTAIDALEWEAIATGELPADDEDELRGAQERADGALHTLLAQRADDPALTALERAFHEYVGLIGLEMASIRQGKIDEAVRIDAERVDPLQEFLSDSIEQLTALNRRQAARDSGLALFGSLLTVLAALLAMAYLAWHVQTARRKIAVTLAERRVEQESEERYRVLFEANPHPMWVVDIETMGFLAVNAAAIEQYGYSRDEFLAMTLQDIRPLDAPQVLAREAQTWQGSSHYHAPAAHRTKSGSVLQAEVACRRMDFAGRLAALSLVRDVTDRLRLEEELRQANKLEAVARLAGGVAHDFNNILTGISGFAQLLVAGCQDEEHRKQRRYAEEIIVATRRAAGLTQQLLAYGRRQVLQGKVLDLNTFLIDMQRTIQPVVGTEIRLEVRRAPDLWPVLIDPAQLEQVIVSLAGQARDSMPQGGALTLETANVRLDQRQAAACDGILPGEYVSITLADTGPGMDEETRSRIFDPFYSGGREGPGASLGLGIAYGILKQSGGSITVENKPGKGTAFRLYLPRVPAQVAVHTPPSGLIEFPGAAKEPSGNGRKVA